MQKFNAVFFIAIAISVSLSVAVFYILSALNKDKVAYVKSAELLNKYNGLAKANEKFNAELGIVKMNYDTLKARYETLLAQKGTVKASNKENWAYRLAAAETELKKFEENSMPQIENRKRELTQQVLNQMNVFIQEYGKKHNYTLIFGTTDNGSILYGKEAIDITNPILEALNGSVDSTASVK